MSLESGIFPSKLKEGACIPTIKKPSEDHENLSNYRPITNLCFLSKVIEKVVAKRITRHLEDENLLEVFQSAYKSNHSTETALTRVHNDILCDIDRYNCVILILLDLSAAFDTVDHAVLLRRLKNCFGITGKPLSWIRSYLSDRTQCVYINGERSSTYQLTCGLPQGSVLGPILYTMYTLPLGNIIRHHNMKYHLYADDTQLYMSFCPSSSNEPDLTRTRIEACIKDIQLWMSSNKLKLNDEKTELLVLHAQNRPQPQLLSISAGDDVITRSNEVRNIGVWFDKTLNMEKHINMTCKSAFYHLRNIAAIRKFISSKDCETLIHAFIRSKIDYCNSLLSGLPAQQLKKLQHVQNSAARLLTLSKKHEHITPILQDLHWLPISERINYKIILLTFKALNNMAPEYLKELLHRYTPKRQLRSSTKNLLEVPKFNMKSYGQRSFSVRAPQLWNNLPEHIKNCSNINTFKKYLKTFLFKNFYDC